jgi:acetoin utilization deacetylase AcuC-like enzyme
VKTERADLFDPEPSLPSPFGRAWNRLRRLLHGRDIGVVYSPLYLVDLGVTPVDVLRPERILAFLLAYGLLEPEKLLRPQIASLGDLRLAHARRYLEKLRDPGSLTEIVGTEVWPDLHRQALLAQRAAVGGTLLATRQALADSALVINLGGGFHHASRLQGKGFCIFNDVAVAIRRARHDGFTGRILVVDLDLHDGNGTRQIFAEDASVFTMSIHNQSWDQAPATASLSLELGPDIEDPTYLGAISRHLPEVLAEVRPELVFYLAGTDPAADDKIGNWRITSAGLLERDRFVVSQVHETGPGTPIVTLLAGGYGNHAWRYTARFLASLIAGHTGIEPPTTAAITIARYRHLTRELRAGDRAGRDEPANDWGLTEADITGGFGVDARRSLFLGVYSHHAVELTLEWTGVLDRLRQMGFSHPVVTLDLDNPGGHTVRVSADPEHTELLIELRVRRDRRSVAGMEVLSLEWLLLQNPRASFSARRPALPGQSHPGLGLMPDIMSLLILICDQQRLDGITFVPSQYHLALKGRRFLRFLDPRDEGWFRALQSSLADLPLAEATAAVARGALRETGSLQTVRWRPMTMVVPISERLHDRVEGSDYERAAAEAAEQLGFEPAVPVAATTGRPSPAGSG